MINFRHLLSFHKNLLIHFIQDNCLQVAAALTFTTLFAVVPVSFVLFTVLKSIPALADANDQIQAFIFDHFVPTSGTEVMTYLQQFASQSTQLTFIGLAILIVTAILLLRTIEQSINQIWGIAQGRKGMVSFLMYWAIISLGPILLASGLLISSWLASSEFLSQTLAWINVGNSLYSVMPWFLNVMAFSLIYIVVPNCYVPWRSGVAGALVAATLFELAKHGFTWFVSNLSSYHLIYGAFAAIPLFLLWIHISWLITLLGVEWVKGLVTWQATQQSAKESIFHQSLRILNYLWRNHAEGRTTSAESLGHYLSDIGCDHWSDIRRFLLQESLIAVNAHGDFLIGRDFHQVKISDLMRNAPWNMAEWREHISHHSSEAWQKELEEQWQGLEKTVNVQFPQTLQTLLSQLSSTHKNP